MSHVLTIDDWRVAINKIPSFSPAVIDVLTLLEDGVSDFYIIEKKLKSDQGLVGRVLSLANSPFYGLSGTIYSVSDACIVLGGYTIKSIVIAASAMDCFERSNINLGVKPELFWKHSIITARYAQKLAARKNMNVDVAFVAGLLHDLGVLLCVVEFPEKYEAVLKYEKDEKCLRMEAEKNILGYDHAKLSGVIVDYWNLPNNICDAIRYHHDLDSTDNKYAVIVHVADVLANSMGFSAFDEGVVQNFNLKLFSEHDISWKDLEELMSDYDISKGL